MFAIPGMKCSIDILLIRKNYLQKNSYIGEHIQIHSDSSKKLKTYTFIFYLRFIPVLYIFIRVFYRIKIIFNNLTNR